MFGDAWFGSKAWLGVARLAKFGLVCLGEVWVRVAKFDLACSGSEGSGDKFPDENSGSDGSGHERRSVHQNNPTR